jgi:hypothetical protein
MAVRSLLQEERMKHTRLVGALASVMLVASVAAQTPAQQKPAPAQPKPAAEKPATETQKPAAPTTTRQTSGTTTAAEVPTGEVSLGTVSIPRALMADGKTLPAGSYTVRLTAQAAQPTVPGQQPNLNRWVEFVQGGNVRGREVVSIIPADEVDDTQQGPDLEVGKRHVPRNGRRVEALKGGDYYRVWINRAGIDYLVHLPTSGGAAR